MRSPIPFPASTRSRLALARAARRLSWTVLAGAGLLAGCSSSKPETIVKVPTYPPLMDPQTAMNQSGGIYQTGTSIAFFETRRARHVGDILTVKLQEALVTANTATTDASRASDISAKAADQTTGTAQRLARLFNVGSADTSFKGKANVTGNDSLTGTLTVSVISTLPSGNLMVAGDKMIATNNVNTKMRFSGIVNPIDIDPTNTVASNRIANARIEETGAGVLSDATSLGWLQRLFLNVLTF
ncbi:flagellar basal body L-ring protein FlgH [Robbsia sp. Bb-Pol-6]|uniref:Flagellar L-ring protein n=1 Tax=Robbsia betulipollinis TaxID=2981849 RepID=A0ABT3ZSV6_9BURK|nr:flagellar basal body L-ring protein FlgH [Robbsia betulipollinis]MCY0389635.1 flagellar basal body L-ring protein FlgH [Robbsia betulipollinis]